MSLEAMLWVFNHSNTTLGARLVLLVLAEYAHDDGTQAFPAVETIARKARMTRRAAQRALQRLEETGHIENHGLHPQTKTKIYSIRGMAEVRGGGVLDDRGGRTSRHAEMSSSTPYPSLKTRQEDPLPPLPPEGDSARSQKKKDVDAVWATYVGVMHPRRREASEEERAIIRKALDVASVDECSTCIRKCFESDYHMKRGTYASRPGGKYNKLSHILRGRRGKETTRERIDWWLDREDVASSSLLDGFPSDEHDKINRAIRDVQRAHHSGDPQTVELAKQAMSYLESKGIESSRRESDGYPVFRRRHGDG